MFLWFQMYAYADYDYTHYLFGPCQLNLHLAYKDGTFNPDFQVVGGRGTHSVTRLPEFRIGTDTVYQDVIHIALTGKVANTSKGTLNYYFARNKGLVYAELKNYSFQPHGIHNHRAGGGYPMGTDGLCDYQEPTAPNFTYNTRNGEYRLVEVIQ